MKPYEILDAASDDLDAAAVWYEEQREGLGLELVADWVRPSDTLPAGTRFVVFGYTNSSATPS